MNTISKVIKQPLPQHEINHLLSLKGDTVLVYGHFSSIHPGHVRYLQNAKSYGSILIIALKGDDNLQISDKYPFSFDDRSNSLKLLNICDFIIQLKNDELEEIVSLIEPSTIILGNEYKDSYSRDILETTSIAKKLNTRVVYDSGDTVYATTDLLRDSKSVVENKRKIAFLSSCKKQNINPSKLVDKLSSLRDTPILIIGDSIVDEYTACEALGMSAEAPVLVVKELDSEIYIGGAAVVASHINSLGGSCYFLSVTGIDSYSSMIKDHFLKQSIRANLFEDDSRPTTYKKRYMVENQKLFRVSRLEDQPLCSELEDQLIDSIREISPKVKGIVISDFNYGVITERIIQEIQNVSKKYNIMIFADSQCSSQVGSIAKFKGLTLLCPNEREARIGLQSKSSGLEGLALQLFDKSSPGNLIMKLGSQGFIAYTIDKRGRIFNQHFPALSSNPVDVAGAGDSLLACMSLSLSSGISMMEASALGCFMCNIAVESVGNRSITYDQLRNKIMDFIE